MLCTPTLSALSAGRGHLPPLEEVETSPKRVAALRPTVFVIDDERTIADTICQILQLSGFNALPFYDGQSAIEQANLRCPSVVITDVAMPDLNGIETAKLLIESCPSTTILLLSGQAAAVEMIDAAGAEGFHFELLAKPLHPDRLLSVVHRHGL